MTYERTNEQTNTLNPKLNKGGDGITSVTYERTNEQTNTLNPKLHQYMDIYHLHKTLKQLRFVCENHFYVISYLGTKFSY